MGSFNESSARDLITRLVHSIGAKDETGVVPFVIAWPKIVGSDLAAHSRVLDIRNNAVLVGVDHPGWLQRMHLEQHRIVNAIQRRFPALDVRYLHFSVIDSTDLTPGDTPVDGSARPPDEQRPETPERDPGGDPGSDGDGDSGLAADEFPVAREDEEFQHYLKGLRDALHRKPPR